MNTTNHPLLGATITWTAATDKPGKVRHITASEALEEIRSGSHAQVVQRLRTIRATDEAAYKAAKAEELPGWIWTGKFSYRSNDRLVQHSGLVCMDFDHLPEDKLTEIRARIAKDPHVFAMFTSPSGVGLKVVVPVEPKPEHHRAQFDALKDHFNTLLAPYGGEVKADKIARALSQLCFVSHDPDLYTNNAVQVFPPPAAEPPPPPPDLADLSPGELAELVREAHRQRDATNAEVVDDTARPILDKLLGMVKPVDFRAQANLAADKAPRPHHHLLLAIANVLAIAKAADHPLARVNSAYFVFNGTYWQPLPMELLRHFLGDAAERMGVNHFDANLYTFKDKLQRQFDDDAFMEPPPPRLGVVKINMANGTFVITPDRQELRDVHDPADFMTYQLSFGYDPDATCPTFMRYLDRVQPDKDCQAVLAEYMGWVFIPHKLLDLQKGLLLHGGGANGKSVFADIMAAMFGTSNVSRVELSAMTKDPNSRLALEHKLVNIATEIETELNDTVFKNYIEGAPLEVKELYENKRLMTNYGKPVFLANTLPRVKDSSEGYFRRLILVPFNQTIPHAERDEGLKRKIIATEMPGVFNWVLTGLRRVWANKDFTKAKAVEDAVAEYREKSDTVLGFINENAVEPCPDNPRPLKEWYAQYLQYCTEVGHRHTVTRNQFSDRLRKHGITVVRSKAGGNTTGSTVVFARCGTIIGDNNPF
jgi:putative DNA primase/helicase